MCSYTLDGDLSLSLLPCLGISLIRPLPPPLSKTQHLQKLGGPSVVHVHETNRPQPPHGPTPAPYTLHPNPQSLISNP